MRVTGILLILCLVLVIPLPAWSAVTSVYYYNGRVYSFDGKSITVGNRSYLLAKGCKYLLNYRRNKAFYEEKSSPGTVRIGDSVTVHINGNVVDEIMVEEWKR